MDVEPSSCGTNEDWGVINAHMFFSGQGVIRGVYTTKDILDRFLMICESVPINCALITVTGQLGRTSAYAGYI